MINIRSPSRIPYVLSQLAKAWLMKPDMRLGQLLWAQGGDPFHYEDYEMLKNISEYCGVPFDDKDLPEYFIGNDSWEDLPQIDKIIQRLGLENLTKEKIKESFNDLELIDMGFCPNDCVRLIKFKESIPILHLINPELIDNECLAVMDEEDFGYIKSICPVCGFTETTGRNKDYDDEVFPI